MKFIKFIFWLALCQLAGLVGSEAVMENMDWYNQLTAPPFTPPNGIFGLVWAVLYALIGIAAFLALKDFPKSTTKKPACLFLLQLALNACWTPIFFGEQNLGAAFILVAGMLAEGVWLLKAFYKQSRWAGNLMIPYMIWIAFATYLTGAFWLLNR